MLEVDVKFKPNTLSEALSFRYPTVWVHTSDVVEVIEKVKSHISLYDDLEFYLLNSLKGLQKYNFTTQRFDTVLVHVTSPNGESLQVPIFDLGQVIDYLIDKTNATLFVANAEQYEDKLNDLFTYLNFEWRDSWLIDTTNQMPCQIIFSSTVESGPPAAVRNIVPKVSFLFPSKEELNSILMFISDKTKVPLDVDQISTSSKGLTLFEAANIYHSMIARTGSIDVAEIENYVFEKLASRVGLDIIRPKVSLDLVAGAENVKSILETSLWIKGNPEEAASLGYKKLLRRFLLVGLPGTGKSYLCEASSNYLNLNLIRTGISHQLSKWHGESENNMKALFEQIRALDPVCVWCDEFGRDAGGSQSSHLVDAGSTSRMHGIFLTELQELPDSTYFFAAANDISQLPPEMLRADRFDKIFFTGFPTEEQRHKILYDETSNFEHDINLEQVAQGTGGFTGAELVTAISIAVNYSISDRRPVNTDDIMKALKNMKDRLWIKSRQYVIKEYETGYDNYQWASDDQHSEAKYYIDGKLPPANKNLHNTGKQTEPVKAKVSVI